MASAESKTLILACGALAKEILYLVKQFGQNAELRCLPAGYHNRPEKIVPALRKILDETAGQYGRVLVGYGDCGTGGQLDALLKDYPHANRLPGAHCYAFYSGLNRFDQMMEEELGTFFLTDYLVRHFETLIIKGFGLDRHPGLMEMFFGNYKRLTFISQTEDPELLVEAKKCALKLGLEFRHKHVGYGGLASAISMIGVDTTLKTGLRRV